MCCIQVVLISGLEVSDKTEGDKDLTGEEQVLTGHVKMSFFLTRREDMATLVEVRKEMLDGVRPAITTVFVAGLVSPDWLVEVEVVACAE